jgi:hypothetical protein
MRFRVIGALAESYLCPLSSHRKSNIIGVTRIDKVFWGTVPQSIGNRERIAGVICPPR